MSREEQEQVAEPLVQQLQCQTVLEQTYLYSTSPSSSIANELGEFDLELKALCALNSST